MYISRVILPVIHHAVFRIVSKAHFFPEGIHSSEASLKLLSVRNNVWKEFEIIIQPTVVTFVKSLRKHSQFRVDILIVSSYHLHFPRTLASPFPSQILHCPLYPLPIPNTYSVCNVIIQLCPFGSVDPQKNRRNYLITCSILNFPTT